MNAIRPIRTPAELVEAGLDRAGRSAPGSSAVAERYAVAITPAMAALIDPSRPERSDRPPVRAGCSGAERHAGGARRSDRRLAHQPGRGHRPPLSRPRAAEGRPCLPGLLPLLLPPRDGGAAGARHPLARRHGRGLRLYRRPSGDLGGDPHRRRSAGALAAPARRDHAAARRHRSREDRPLPHPRAGRRAGADRRGR